MSTDAEKSAKSAEKVKKLSQEQVISYFNQMRQEQKLLVTKLSEVEQDLNEHSLVVDALKDVDQDRICYRMIGGVLVERTVKEVLPAVIHNKEQLTEFIERLNQQIEKKGTEINEFKQKYNIQIRREAPILTPEPSKEESQPSSSILVETES